MRPTLDELIDRAIRAYTRRFGPQADAPAKNATLTHHSGVIILRNTYRELATYRIRGDGTLRFVS